MFTKLVDYYGRPAIAGGTCVTQPAMLSDNCHSLCWYFLPTCWGWQKSSQRAMDPRHWSSFQLVVQMLGSAWSWGLSSSAVHLCRKIPCLSGAFICWLHCLWKSWVRNCCCTLALGWWFFVSCFSRVLSTTLTGVPPNPKPWIWYDMWM